MKRKKANNQATIVRLVVLAALIGFGYWAWLHRAQLRSAVSPPHSITDAGSGDMQPAPTQLSGKLEIVQPPRDAQLGVAADAAILFRKVEMFQWQEHCDGSDCRYETAWSEQHVDSSKFHTPVGHENPAAPFAGARFVAGEIRLAGLTVAPELVAAAHPAIDYPARADMLPPNLAATFNVINGALYAGGDPAQPRPGTLRVSFRIVPGGEISLAGVRRGAKLEAQ